MRSWIRRGTKMLIVADYREGAPALGKIAKVVGFEETLTPGMPFNADGSVIMDSPALEEVKKELANYPDEVEGEWVEWDPDKEDFPGRKCFVAVPPPIYELEDGIRLTTKDCYGLSRNSRVKERQLELLRLLLERAGSPEEQIQMIISAMRVLGSKDFNQ